VGKAVLKGALAWLGMVAVAFLVGRWLGGWP
jgi:hypothetical protein